MRSLISEINHKKTFIQFTIIYQYLLELITIYVNYQYIVLKLIIKYYFKKINIFLPFGLTHVRYNRIMQTWYFLEALNLQGFSKSNNGKSWNFQELVNDVFL